MFIRLMQDLLGSSMLLMVIWLVMGVTGLNKKGRWAGQMFDMLTNMFKPALVFIRKLLPATEMDYSPVVFIFALWSAQRFLFLFA